MCVCVCICVGVAIHNIFKIIYCSRVVNGYRHGSGRSSSKSGTWPGDAARRSRCEEVEEGFKLYNDYLLPIFCIGMM